MGIPTTRYVDSEGAPAWGISDVAQMATGYEVEDLMSFAGEVGSSWRRIRDRSADTGTIVHAGIRYALTLELSELPTVDKSQKVQAARALGRFNVWAASVGLSPDRVLYCEEPLIDHARGLGGTPDLIWQHPEHGVVLCDWKTSARPYLTHLVQTAAYARAAKAELDLDVKQAWVVRIPRAAGIERVGVRTLAVPSESYREALEAFDAAHTLLRAWPGLLEANRETT